uniref:uncharacterized protein LOC122608443 n=1 Tax=Erigeron canadensis TaxID=72917 RepID=UPI001CB98C1C|nr:uncharacterized protein LOC122608443 [Erigeron canadensis]
MSMTTKYLSSQYLIAKVNVHECLITHKAHVNLPFNSISYIPNTKHTAAPNTSTITTRWNSMIVYANDNVDPPVDTPSSPPARVPSSAWKNWVIGILMTFVVPSVSTKGGPIKLMMQKVDNIMDTAEHITDIVEAVADKVDKVIEETEGNLPEGSQIRKTLDYIENVAERIEKDAHTAGDYIDKVQEMQDKIEYMLESILEEAEVTKEATEKEKSKRK